MIYRSSEYFLNAFPKHHICKMYGQREVILFLVGKRMDKCRFLQQRGGFDALHTQST